MSQIRQIDIINKKRMDAVDCINLNGNVSESNMARMTDSVLDFIVSFRNYENEDGNLRWPNELQFALAIMDELADARRMAEAFNAKIDKLREKLNHCITCQVVDKPGQLRA